MPITEQSPDTRNKEKPLELILNAVLSFIRVVRYQPEFQLSISDRISAIGLSMLYSELLSSEKISLIMLLIAYGTALDNLADEGPEGDSKSSGLNNFEMLNQMGILLTQIATINDHDLLNETRQYFVDVYRIETYFRDKASQRSLDSEEQLHYREIVNLIWTLTYCVLAKNDVFTLVNEDSETLPEDLLALPFAEELMNEAMLSDEEFQKLKSKYMSLLAETQEKRMIILFNLVMECSNWYDVRLNSSSHVPTTPRIISYEDKYKSTLDEHGFPTYLTDIIFIAMYSFIEFTRTLRRVIDLGLTLRNVFIGGTLLSAEE